MRSPNIRYIPAIDHLRAYAALLVVFYHGLHLFSYELRYDSPFTFDHWLQSSNPLAAALIEGHISVALFFVLSGFIFTYGVGSNALKWRGFLRNRLLRTAPMYVFLVFVAISAYPNGFDLIAFVQTVFGLGNMPGGVSGGPFLSPTWTVAVEWQFYLLFPVLLLILRTDWTSKLTGLIAILIAFRAIAALNDTNVAYLTHLTILGRLDQFLIGMWLAHWYRSHKLGRRSGAAIAAVSVLAIFAVLTVMNALGGWPEVHSWRFLWPDVEGILCAAFVAGYLAAVSDKRRWWSWTIASIGKISYSTYLIHFAIIETMILRGFLIRFTGDPESDALLNTLLFALPVTLALSTLTYHFIERPFLELRVRYHGELTPGAPATSGTSSKPANTRAETAPMV